MMDILAAVVVVATFVFIIRGAEVRLALLAGGAVLALAAWKPEAWFKFVRPQAWCRRDC